MRKQPLHSRRGFFSYCGWSVATLVSACQSANEPQKDLDGFILEQMQRNHIPGLAASVVKSGKLAWSRGYGWANIEQLITMTPDTLQNIVFVNTWGVSLDEIGERLFEEADQIAQT